ncbi:MAG: peptide ABC transporter substrate-binding protein [Bauldia sp.]
MGTRRSVAFFLGLAAAAVLITAVPASSEVVLRRGNAAEPQTLDQHHTSIDIERNILKDLYEGLTVYDPAGKVVGGAAEKWTISPDGTVYTFTIRADAKWSDGTPVTADDFVYSFRRAQDPKTAAGYANILYPIKNSQKINSAKPDAPVPLDQLGVKAVNAKTLEITLERPTPYLLQLLAHQTALPVNRASIEKNGANFVRPGLMVSNGAFMLTEQVANDHITLSKNPHYWDAANVKIDKVMFFPTSDAAAAVRRFQAGDLDLNYNFPADQRDFLKQQLGADQVRVAPYLSTYYYVFDTRKEPFNDPNVRLALSMAIDRDFLSEKIYANTQLPLYSFVPPGLEGYSPATADFAKMSQLDREDRARALLKAAGYGAGGKPLKIEIRFNTNVNHQKVATAIADMWKGLGATVTILNNDTAAHYDYLRQGNSFDVARAGWGADYADAENFLALATSGNKDFNYGHYSNARYDDLMKRSYDERDLAVRAKMLHDAETLLIGETATVPLMNTASLWLVSRKVKGFVDNAVNDHMSRYLSIQ